MAEYTDIVEQGNVSTPDMRAAFPSLEAQQSSAPAQSFHIDTIGHPKEYAIFGGVTHGLGNPNLEHHQLLIGVQTFHTDHLSHVLTSNFNNPYNDKSAALLGCAETSFIANSVSMGACLGIEHGLKDVNPDLTIFGGSLVPKAEIYGSVLISKDPENFLPSGTNIKIGVESIPVPDGSYDPVATLQIRIPLRP